MDDGDSVMISLYLLVVFMFFPILIVFCVVKAIKHTLIIRTVKKRDKIPTALRASLINVNGPMRRYGIKD